jgi:small-conductance mechanosensitive channel
MKALQEFFAPGGKFAALFSTSGIRQFIIGLAIGAGVLVLSRLLKIALGLFLKRRVPARASLWAGKTVSYLGFAVAILVLLDVAGIDIRALLGAAGIAGIAVGFAAQTSIANIISGLFLLSEKSFAVGDVIKSGDATGIVMSIDLLSVKLRTFDNQQMRLPNESLIKNVLVNLSRFPLRRLNLTLTVGHGQDLEELRDILKEAAAGIKEILIEPEPFFMVEEFKEEGVSILFGLWMKQDDMVKVKNAMAIAIQRAFGARGVAYPFKRMAMKEGAGN